MNLRIPVPILAAAALAALLAGCTSEDPSAVGSGLGTVVVDSVLVPLKVENLAAHSQLDVIDSTFVDQGVLYLGSQRGTASAILVNFDFSDTNLVRNDSMTVDMIRSGNIVSPRLRLNMLDFYTNLRRPDGSGSGLRKYYQVYRLDAPFDTSATWPGAIPPHGASLLNASSVPDAGESFIVEIALPADSLVTWLEDGWRVGFLIQEGPAAADVDSGMVGFSSRENRFPKSTINPLENVTIRKIGPTLRCKFAAEDLEWSMGSQADVSTFHKTAPAPPIADGITVRTVARSYPALYFDLGKLPANAYINRAVLVVCNDTLSGFGNLQSLAVSELDTTEFQSPARTMTRSDLTGAIDYQPAVIDNVDPTLNVRFDFNVTQTIQRYVNDAYTGVRGLVLTGNEGDLAMGPGFWLSQFDFYGLAADSTLRPRLEISYSVNNMGGRP